MEIIRVYSLIFVRLAVSEELRDSDTQTDTQADAQTELRFLYLMIDQNHDIFYASSFFKSLSYSSNKLHEEILATI